MRLKFELSRSVAIVSNEQGLGERRVRLTKDKAISKTCTGRDRNSIHRSKTKEQYPHHHQASSMSKKTFELQAPSALARRSGEAPYLSQELVPKNDDRLLVKFPDHNTRLSVRDLELRERCSKSHELLTGNELNACLTRYVRIIRPLPREQSLHINNEFRSFPLSFTLLVLGTDSCSRFECASAHTVCRFRTRQL